MTATIYSPLSSCSSINENCVRDLRICSPACSAGCVCGPAAPEFDYCPPPLDLLTMSASTISNIKEHHVLTTHSPERCFHFSISIQSPTTFLQHTQYQYFMGSSYIFSSSAYAICRSSILCPIYPLHTQQPRPL